MLGTRRKGVLTSTALAYVQSVAGLVITAFVARQLGAERYGLIAFGLVVSGIATTIIAFASNKTLVRDLVRSETPAQVMTASLVLRLILTLAVLSVLAASALATGMDAGKAAVMLLVTSWAALFELQPRAWFDMHYRMHVHALFGLLDRLGYGLAVAVLWLVYDNQLPGAVAVALCMLAPRVLAWLAQWRHVGARLEFRVERRAGLAVGLMQSNAIVFLASMANLLMTHVNQLMLDWRVGAASLAGFSIVFQVMAMVRLMQQQLVRYITPGITRITSADNPTGVMRRALIRHLAIVSAGSVALVAPVVVLLPMFWQRILGDSFAAPGAVLPLLALWIVVLGAGVVTSRYLLCLHRERAYLWLAIAGGIAALMLGAALIPVWGAAGVAASLLLSHAATLIGQLVIARNSMAATAAVTDGTGDG